MSVQVPAYLGLLFALVLLPPRQQTSPEANSPILQKGVVVEQVAGTPEAQKLGLQRGDILLVWSRAGVNGVINSPFDLSYVRFEQAARGATRIEGLRGGQKRSWLLETEEFDAKVRPNLNGSLLSIYLDGQSLIDAGRFEMGLVEWRAAAATADKNGIPWLRSWLLMQIGLAARRAARWDVFDQSFREATSHADDTGPDVRAELFRQWAYGLNFRSELADAEKQYEQELAERRKSPSEGLMISRSLGDLAYISLEEGELTKAERYLSESQNILEKLAPTSNLMIVGLINFGVLYEDRGNLAEAEKFYRRALALEQKYFPASGNFINIFTNLGIVAAKRGNSDLAEIFHRRALTMAQKVAPASLMVADILGQLGKDSLDKGNLAAAADFEAKALQIRQKLAPDGLYMASSLAHLGRIAQMHREYGQAEEYYRRAVAIADKLDHRSLFTAEYLVGLGNVVREQARLVESEGYFQRALKIANEVASDSESQVQAWAGLARTLSMEGKTGEAAQAYKTALEIFEGHTTNLGGADEDRFRYRASHVKLYQDYSGLLVDQRQPETAFELMERSRARTLLEVLSTGQIDVRIGIEPASLNRERDLRQQISAKSQYRIRLFSQKHTEEQLDNLQREIAGLRLRYDEVEAEIRANSPGYAALTQPQPLSAKEIQQLLDPDTVLLEYSVGEDRSLLWLVTQNSLNVYQLPKRAEIESAARRLYSVLTKRNENNSTESQVNSARRESEYASASTELSRMILGPVALQLEQKRLLVVSDGALQYAPFSALPSPINSGVPLIAEHEIINLPSASVLAELRRARQTRPQPFREVAVLADPVFDPTDERVAIQRPGPGGETSANPISAQRSSMRKFNPSGRVTRSAKDIGLKRNGAVYLRRLLYSRQEAEAIMAVTPKGKRMKAIDFRATRSLAMNPMLGQYRIVHFATHGLVDSKNPELSGLVLSLVDEHGKLQDGFLSLEDVYNLRLPVDLVVLSACETGLGEEVSGEGLIGLTRGFMYAGASRVLASLWAVNDAATSELMARFYRAMELDRMAPAAALRKAQIEMWGQRRWHSPYYWAAFQIQGEWI